MKKIYTFILALVMCNGLYAQDPAVSGATFDKTPALLNYHGKLTFTFANANGAAIDYDGTRPAVLQPSLTIGLKNLTPDLEADGTTLASTAVTGAGAAYFTWTYDKTNNEIKGVLKATVPAFGTQGYASLIEVGVTFSTATPQNAPNNSAIINVQPGFTNGGTNKSDNDATEATTYTDGVLPVGFGFTTASFTGGKLSVEWSTESEIENKAFFIEASKDGKDFTRLDEVATKAENGNSSAAIKYSYSKDWQEIAAQFGFSPLQMAIMALLLISVLISAKRAKKGAMLFSLALLITVGVGCRKDKKELEGMDEYPTVFIRIGQINKDGSTTNYSKVVKVLAE